MTKKSKIEDAKVRIEQALANQSIEEGRNKIVIIGKSNVNLPGRF